MAKTTTFTFRVDPEIKKDAGELFEQLGISLSDAINLFLVRSIYEGGIPFEIKISKNLESELNK